MKLFLIFLLLASCAFKPKPPKPKLFPFGTYQHLVTVDVKGQKFQFPGMNQWTQTHLLVVALGAFDMTVMRYKESFKPTKKEIFIDHNVIPLSDEKMLLYLSILKDIYSLDHSICKEKLCRDSFYGQDFYFDLDENGAVKSIRATRENVKLNVEVVSYEKNP